METAAISYRVADFLKTYPPFNAMEQPDLLQLAQQGRVKFFEPHQFIVTQGSSRMQVLVIQQGTVLLWDERGSEAKLLDVRGAGDLIGIDGLGEVRSQPYAVRSASDVLVYAFPIEEFETLVEKYPDAGAYVRAYAGVGPDDRSAHKRREPHEIFLHELVAGGKSASCASETSIRDAVRQMLSAGVEAIAVLDSEERPRATLTARSFLEWLEKGGGNADEPVAAILNGSPVTIAPDATVTDGVLALGTTEAAALAITSDGTLKGRIQAVVTPAHVGQLFGDRPHEILREISNAPDSQALRQINQRARALVLRYLSSADASGWLARFSSTVDENILRRVLAMTVPDGVQACWSFCGASGRGESVTNLAPQLVMIARDGQERSRWLDAFHAVHDKLNQCGYLPNSGSPDPALHAATVVEWKERYAGWLSDPILREVYQARPFFDLRAIAGQEELWRQLQAGVEPVISNEFLHVVANDCLATLPPLTFFQNAVVDETGEETTLFRLEETALRPLVDVGRVFGMAARRVFGTSTLERFSMARERMPQHASVFQEASATLRIVLWQQGRAGITQNTAGSEVPPALLGPYERQLLRGAFRSILRLLEFTADLRWLKDQ
jgi:CBS domain-containing protein